MNINQVYKVKDNNDGPTPGLRMSQFPKMVEDPFTGEMKPFGDKESKVEDAVDDKTQIKVYSLTKALVKKYQKTIYPSFSGDINDLASEIYMKLITPKTSREDIAKLKEEFPGKPMEWYRYKQNVYDKTAPVEAFDPKKDGDNFEGFIKLLVQRSLIDKVRTDSAVRAGVKLTSMDTTSADEDGDERENEVLKEVSMTNTTEGDGIDVDGLIDRILTLSEEERSSVRKKLHRMLMSKNISTEMRMHLGRILLATKSKKDIEKESKKPSLYMQTKGLLDREFSAEEFPFGIKPEIRRDENHQRGLVFVFNSREEAKEAFDAHDAEMQDKGFQSGRVWGKTIKYSPKVIE